MTIVVAVKYNGNVVMASDKQSTFNDPIKSKKISKKVHLSPKKIISYRLVRDYG